MQIGNRAGHRGMVFLWLFLPVLAWAYEGQYNIDRQGRAIHGYDPVAYFTAGQATPGRPDLRYRWSGADWLFASPENRRAFAAEPRRYAPQYGGFCAYAASFGQFADGDPRAWTLVDGRLYLNYSPRVRETWRSRADEFIRDADTLWPRMDAANP